MVGFAQSLALLPGISRSGSAIVAGLLRDLRHEDAARYSFLLATPVILAASVLEFPKLFAPDAHGVLDSLDVGITLLRRSKKVKHRAVVPDVERLGRQVHFENVAFEPRNPAGCEVSHSGSCPIQCG